MRVRLFFVVAVVGCLAANAQVWQAGASMTQARYAPRGVRLFNSSRVLVAGGQFVLSNNLVKLDTSEVFDVDSNEWTRVGSMNEARCWGTLTALQNGDALAAGGVTKFDATTASEVFSSATGRWTVTKGKMSVQRESHTATLLRDGRVFVVGGFVYVIGSATATATSEVYTPTTQAWSNGPSMSVGRLEHTATMLSDGRVLLVGGVNGLNVVVRTSEVYDPVANTITAVGNLNQARCYHTATLLSNGDVLVAGGTSTYDMNKPGLASVELFSAQSLAWTQVGSLTGPRIMFEVWLLPTGGVLAAGGLDLGVPLKTAEVYNTVTRSWEAASPMSVPRYEMGTVLLDNGNPMVLGGGADRVAYTILATTEIFDSLKCGPGTFGPTCTSCTLCQHGTCVEGDAGECRCDAQWGGTLCDACAPGFFGPACETACTQCSNGATCIEGLQGRCECTPNWTGDRCTACAAGYFGASCTACALCRYSTACHDGVDGYCDCFANWGGTVCDQCAPNYYGPSCLPCPIKCLNNGKCRDGLQGNGTCVCPPGVWGEQCEQGTCQMLGCSGSHGVCQDSGVCTCIIGWIGNHCQTPQECTADKCQNSGTCVLGTDGYARCACEAGYNGTFCEMAYACRTTEGACQHGGECLADGVDVRCVCSSGYEGASCEQVSLVVTVFALLPIVLGFVTAGIIYFLGRLRNPDAHNTVIFTVVFGILDVLTDLLFVTSVYDDPTLEAFPVAIAATFVAAPIIVNLGLGIYFLTTVLPSNPAWFSKHQGVIAVMALLSLTNVESLGIMTSRMFKWEMFSAEWPDWSLERLKLFGLGSIFFEDIPQIILQSIVLARVTHRGQLGAVTVISMFMSVVSVLHALLQRFFMVQASQSSQRRKLDDAAAPVSASAVSPEFDTPYQPLADDRSDIDSDDQRSIGADDIR